MKKINLNAASEEIIIISKSLLCLVGTDTATDVDSLRVVLLYNLICGIHEWTD